MTTHDWLPLLFLLAYLLMLLVPALISSPCLKGSVKKAEQMQVEVKSAERDGAK